MANEIAGYVGLSRMMALQRQLDVVTNNIANMNTTGFKSEQSVFHEHLERLGNPGNREEQSYVLDIGTYRDLGQGALEATGNPFDVAIHGDGWFSYMGDEGQVYGRDGRLLLDDMGRLTTAAGHPILDINGAEIVLPMEGANDVNIAADGTISAGDMALAQIGVFEFDNPQELERLGNGFYQATNDAFPLPAFDVRIAQGMVERSNVEPIIEMTRLMQVHRAYDRANQLGERSGELQSQAIRRLGQVR